MVKGTCWVPQPISQREWRAGDVRQGEEDGATPQEAELEHHKWGKTWLEPTEPNSPSLQNGKHDTRRGSDPDPKPQPCRHLHGGCSIQFYSSQCYTLQLNVPLMSDRPNKDSRFVTLIYKRRCNGREKGMPHNRKLSLFPTNDLFAACELPNLFCPYILVIHLVSS